MNYCCPQPSQRHLALQWAVQRLITGHRRRISDYWMLSSEWDIWLTVPTSLREHPRGGDRENVRAYGEEHGKRCLLGIVLRNSLQLWSPAYDKPTRPDSNSSTQHQVDSVGDEKWKKKVGRRKAIKGGGLGGGAWGKPDGYDHSMLFAFVKL